jgi:uncharacterized protein (DUF2164 family)
MISLDREEREWRGPSSLAMARHGALAILRTPCAGASVSMTSTHRAMPVSLSDDATAMAVASIRRYFMEHLEQELGDLQARLLLEFVLKEIGPSVYNAAIADAQIWMRDRVADLESVCYAPEFTYWPRGTGRRPAR